MARIYQELLRLESVIGGIRFGNLKDNEKSVSILLHTTNIVMRTHQKDKIAVLQNSILNSAITIIFMENIQQIFLNLIERYTPLHLMSLEFS